MRTGAEVVSDSGDEARLHAEAVAFTRYLLRVDPTSEVTVRYVAANRALLSEPPTARDCALLETCLARPWTLPFLDAAEARRDPPSLLRKKVLVLSAVLETTTQFAPHFLPLKRWGPALFLELGFLGSLAVFRMLGGMVLVRALPGLRA
jgi:hypothetical protein